MAENYSALGVEHIQLRPSGADPVAFVERFGETIAPRLAQIH